MLSHPTCLTLSEFCFRDSLAKPRPPLSSKAICNRWGNVRGSAKARPVDRGNRFGVALVGGGGCAAHQTTQFILPPIPQRRSEEV